MSKKDIKEIFKAVGSTDQVNNGMNPLSTNLSGNRNNVFCGISEGISEGYGSFILKSCKKSKRKFV